jgi:DNA-binding transcriptional regulator YdaS (Cro superfamily)
MEPNTDSEKAALYRAAEILGGQAALGIAIGINDRRRVWPWFSTHRRVPVEHCPSI